MSDDLSDSFDVHIVRYEEGFQSYVPVGSLIYKAKLIGAFHNQSLIQQQYNQEMEKKNNHATTVVNFSYYIVDAS